MVIPRPLTDSESLVAFLSYLKSYNNMGEAQVTCILGCSCGVTNLQGSWARHASLTILQPIELEDFAPGTKCYMQIMHIGGASPTSKFKLSGVMLAQKDNLLNAAGHSLFGHYSAD